MEIDNPDAKAELEAAFRRYEVALTTNDVATLDELFKDAPYTVRYGATEVLHGYAEIAAFRAARPSQGLARTLIKTVITTFGRDFGTASTTFRRDGGTKLGRQMQTWVRFPGEGWRVVAAHVSLMDEPKS
ncbi:MAG: oxalurate catabolism protein HpxZ [Tagaea sp.]|jgi:hypothetical protein|nr:oxalurate catabolism protein HpxZ [Azospirillum sp.]MCA3267324.1 oxalurate catabolism protein HpxZ [Azospirillum sp.]MCZ8123968.1 oxalurate catabolism protein HpxZ [Magnetospirillum sp.]